MISRRRLLMAGFVAAPLSALGTYGYARGPGRKEIAVREIDLAISNLPGELDGFRIAHLSDFHIDPLIEHELHTEAVRLTNQLEPDLVALTGDFVSNNAGAIEELSPILSKLESKSGVVSCLGNHDCWGARSGAVKRSLERKGVRVLINDGFSLSKDGPPIFVAGVDSVWGGRPDPIKAFAGCGRSQIGVLLCHEPDVFPRYTGDNSPIALMLSGHTHGGQVRIPFVGAPILPPHGKDFQRGMYQNAGAHLHVNPGIGTVDKHVRFLCPPEVTLLKLCAA